MPDGPVRGLDCLSWVYKEVLEWSLIRIALLLLVAFATAFGLVQATSFNLDAAPLAHVLLWVGCALLCWPLWHAVLAGVLYLMRLRPPREIALAAGLATAFVTLPSTAVVYSVSAWVRGHYPGALAVYAEVAIPALLLSGLFLYIACQRVKERYAHLAVAPAAIPGDTNAGTPGTAASGFFDRLPPMLGEDIVYLGVSGHYLNVVTTAGSHPVLMRLSDAVAALGGRGMRVHRSYWVAFRHLTGTVRRDARTLVCVTGGEEVPVSRTYAAAVRAAVEAR
ncbi:MAG: LytTR family transcriptional regulator [Gammaproteobacteria bacterium]|nr:LytTR family transcriptional regulator [Gammaproteobacteria bacterium]MYE81222.1 LytTR family transcriptional regulator [Gammaproteobacteria bacterium]